MLYSQSPPLTAEETSSGGLAHDPDVRSDQRIGRRRMKPSIDPPHSYRFGEGQLASGRPSIGRRIFRAFARFFTAVLIGVGATLAWQSHGDDAKQIVRTWAPSLGWLLPVSTTKSPPDGQVSAHDAALPQSSLQLQSCPRRRTGLVSPAPRPLKEDNPWLRLR